MYLRALPDSIKEYILSATDLKERRQRIIAAVAILREHPLDIFIVAAKQALEFGRTDINTLKMIAARLVRKCGSSVHQICVPN